MKKSFYVVLIVVFIIAVAMNVKKVEKPKQAEIEKQPVLQPIQTSELPTPWVPKSIVFCNRLIFLEGEIKQRLIRELKDELKGYKSEGLTSIKNNMWLHYIEK